MQNTDDHYYRQRNNIRKIWCVDIPVIKMDYLSKLDLYRLGILLNSYDDLTYMKFDESNNIFIAPYKLSTTIVFFLHNCLLKVNRKIHVTAFTDDGMKITHLSLVRFDLNVDSIEDNGAIDACRNGAYTLTDDEFISIYEEAAVDILYNYYRELCAMHYDSSEEVHILTPVFIKLIRSLSVFDALDSIFKAYHNYRRSKNRSFVQMLEKPQNSYDKDSQTVRVSLKIPESVEINYLYKLLGLDQTAFGKTENELLSIYREAHRE